MVKANELTFEEGCNMYLEDCRQRNLRDGTIRHYRQSYTQFYKYFNPQMPISDINEKAYKKYVVYLRETLNNDVSINSYLRDLITTLHFLMNEGLLERFQMRANKKYCTYPKVTSLYLFRYKKASDNRKPFCF